MVHSVCSHVKGVYNLSALILHAASLHQGFPHCARFLVAATRRCQDRVSVPMWLIILSDQLTVLALVGHYPTNKLIVSRPISKRLAALVSLHLRYYSQFPRAIPNFEGGNLLVTHPFAASFISLCIATQINKSRSTCMPKARRQRSS
jgi:hypothetical protein